MLIIDVVHSEAGSVLGSVFMSVNGQALWLFGANLAHQHKLNHDSDMDMWGYVSLGVCLAIDVAFLYRTIYGME